MHLRRATVTAQLFFKVGKELELQRNMEGRVWKGVEVVAGVL